MLKRLRWLAYGAVAGSIGTIAARRRLATRLGAISGGSLSGSDNANVADRIAGAAVTGAKGAGRKMGSLLHDTENAFKDAARVGQEEAKNKEEEMWEEISRTVPEIRHTGAHARYR